MHFMFREATAVGVWNKYRNVEVASLFLGYVRQSQILQEFHILSLNISLF